MSGYTSSLRQIGGIAVAAAAIGMGALAAATQAGADPVAPAVPGQPAAPGQPVLLPPGAQPVAAPAPPPVGAPPVPEIANQQYGQGSRPGPFAFLRDAWNMAQNPHAYTGPMQPGDIPPAAAPPPGAGPAPQLPPGYQSLTDPASSGPAPSKVYEGGPPLPEGYYPLTGPPPPGYFDAPPDPNVQQPVNPNALPPGGPIAPRP